MSPLVILIVLGVLGYLFYLHFFKEREGLTSYTDCMGQGYTKEFCVRTPLSQPWVQPNSCFCENGKMGTIMPGFRGECVCPEEILGW